MIHFNMDKVPWDLIPKHMIYGLQLYVEDGVRPGGFMQLVLSGDMEAAKHHADPQNAKCLDKYPEILKHLPEDCYGSPEDMEAWIESKGLRGRR